MTKTVTTLEVRPFARRAARTFSAASGIRFLRLHARAFPVRRHLGAICETPEVGNGQAAQQRGKKELTAQQQERRTTNDRVKVRAVLFHNWGGERFQRVRCLRHIRYAARGA
jgi:hypothetical protein